MEDVQYSMNLNLSKTQLYLGLIAQSIIILSATFGLAMWIGRVMVHQEFESALKEFHAVARPQFEATIDSRIDKYHRASIDKAIEQREDVLQRLQNLETISRERDARLKRIEDKLDMLIARR